MNANLTTYADPNVPGLARGSDRSGRCGTGRARLLAIVLVGGLVGSVGSPALAGQREEGQLLRLTDLPEGYAEEVDEDADEPGPSRTLCDLKLPIPLADAERTYNSGGAFWSCPGLTDTVCKGRGTLEVSVDHAFIEEAGAVGEEATTTAAEAATS